MGVGEIEPVEPSKGGRADLHSNSLVENRLNLCTLGSLFRRHQVSGRPDEQTLQLASEELLSSSVVGAKANYSVPLAGNERTLFQETASALLPGLSALSTRIAMLAVRGQLHTDIRQIERILSTADTPMGAQLVERMYRMRADGWRISQVRPGDIWGLGEYNPQTRDISYCRRDSYVPFLVGAKNTGPRETIISTVVHEAGHHDALTNLPKRFIEGQSAERVSAFRALAAETNAIMAEAHMENARGVSIFSSEYLRNMKENTLGSHIRNGWYEYNREFASITAAEAREFVNEYIGERWGDPLNARGEVKPYRLNPEPLEAVAEMTKFDPDRLNLLKGDFAAHRKANGTETSFHRLLRASQTRVGSAAVHGAKIFCALGTLAAIQSVRSGFRSGLSDGCGELAKVGIGFAGFELGAAAARFGRSAPIGRTLFFGFVGASVAEKILGEPLSHWIRRDAPLGTPFSPPIVS